MPSQKRSANAVEEAEKKPRIDWFEHMPQEVLARILGHIECADISRARVVCMRFFMTLRDPVVPGNIFSSVFVIWKWPFNKFTRTVCANFAIFPADEQAAILAQLSTDHADNLRMKIRLYVDLRCRQAARGNKVKDVEFLLDHGVTFDRIIDLPSEFTMMHYACKYGSHAVVELLLARGMDPSQWDRSVPDPLLLATRFGHLNIMQLLLSRRNDAHEAYLPISALFDAYVQYNNCVAGLQFLRERGAEIFPCALVHAASAGHEIAIRWLIENGAPIDAYDRATDNTPLSAAIRRGSRVTVTQLLLLQADFNTPINNGLTPLMIAAACQHVVIAGDLCKAGANVNATNIHNDTALHIAARSSNTDLMRVLLEAGADPSARNDEFFAALRYVAEKDNYSAVELLVAHNAILDDVTGFRDSTLIYVTVTRKYRIARLLLQKGASPNTASIFYPHEPALVIAASVEARNLVLALLKAGADVDGCDTDGMTALMMAAQHNDIRIVAVLLHHKASVNAKNAQGMTAHMFAVIGNYDYLAGMLVWNGAEVLPIPEHFHTSEWN